MSTQLIKTPDGALIEIAAEEGMLEQVSSAASHVENGLSEVQNLLKKSISPVVSVWDELNRDLNIDEVNIKLSLGFSVEGNVFIAKGSGSANIDIALKVKPKPDDA